MPEPERLSVILHRPAAMPKPLAAHAFTTLAKEHLRALRVPTKYATATLASMQLYGSSAQRECTAKAVRVARRLVGEYPEWQTTLVAFTGSYGTGKSHLGWAVAKHLAEFNAAAVRFVELADLVRDLRSAWGKSGEDERTTLKFYRELDVLVINDVSRHAFLGHPMQHLFDVLESRINFGRLTLLTSNEGDAELKNILGGALWERLTGFDGGLVDCGTESFRQLTTTERKTAECVA